MVHNGIEYGIMAAYAEGLNILHHANVGKHQQEIDAETSPPPSTSPSSVRHFLKGSVRVMKPIMQTG
jgi:6-phosphogluconate dehydrogenase (decarboxylating)